MGRDIFEVLPMCPTHVLSQTFVLKFMFLLIVIGVVVGLLSKTWIQALRPSIEVGIYAFFSIQGAIDLRIPSFSQ